MIVDSACISMHQYADNTICSRRFEQVCELYVSGLRRTHMRQLGQMVFVGNPVHADGFCELAWQSPCGMQHVWNP